MNAIEDLITRLNNESDAVLRDTVPRYWLIQNGRRELGSAGRLAYLGGHDSNPWPNCAGFQS